MRFCKGASEPSMASSRLISAAMRSPWKIRIKSSSQLTKNWVVPGSPWRPPRPRSWLSTRRLSWRSEPITTKPPSSLTPSPSLISVPRPAKLVARVTAPFSPALATIAASRSLFLAFKSSYLIPWLSRYLAINSFLAMLAEPTKTGCPRSWYFLISAAIALSLAASVLKIRSSLSTRWIGLLGGIWITSKA